MPARSAQSVRSAIAGAQRRPKPAEAATTRTASAQPALGHARSRVVPAVRLRAMRNGKARPRRSASRPPSRLVAASANAAATNVAETAIAPAPSSPSRSGANTPRSPAKSAPSTISQSPRMKLLSRLWRRGRANLSAWPDRSGTSQAATAASAAKTAVATKTGSRPNSIPAAPRAGPITAPAIAMASTDPSSSPRRAEGPVAAIQVSAPSQAQHPPTPCSSLRASIRRTEFANGNPRLPNERTRSPRMTARLPLVRETRRAAGRAPSRVPAP